MDTYKATNTTNGKFYIGSTTNFDRRKAEHLKSEKTYPFQNALRKNPELFEWEVWSDDCDEPVLEQALLEMWFGKECCYNLNSQADRVNKEFCAQGGRNQGRKNVENGHWGNLKTFEHQSMAGKRGGRVTGHKHLREGTGLFAQTREQLVENSRKANSQVWESTHDGFRGNAGNVARHNKINGWDPSDRVKLS